MSTTNTPGFLDCGVEQLDCGATLVAPKKRLDDLALLEKLMALSKIVADDGPE